VVGNPKKGENSAKKRGGTPQKGTGHFCGLYSFVGGCLREVRIPWKEGGVGEGQKAEGNLG